jgi:O-antigen/teichoic acid export membrane protein
MAETTSNKRVAKNTVYLYIRMLLVMIVSIYTSRIVLENLGIEDYGIYNVVGSVVTMFAFLKTALAGATHRYVAYSLGQGDAFRLKVVFSNSLLLHVIIALLIVFMAESIGLWFLYNKLVIPEIRFDAALWAFQFSIFVCFIGVVEVPFDAEIIAHERMGIYAYVAIVDVFVKLGIAFLLAFTQWDKLIFYAALLFLLELIKLFFYYFYCRLSFNEVRISYIKDYPLMKEMSMFAGWNLFGHFASAIYAQGLNILLNIFFGPIVNAARGISVSVNAAVHGFITNFQTAVMPQITKSFASQDLERYRELIFMSSKFSFYLYLIIAFPVFLEIDTILGVWLVEVPAHANNFIRLVLIGGTTSAFFSPINHACLATGHNRLFISIRGLTTLIIIPVSYILLLFIEKPEVVYFVEVIVLFVSIFIQIRIAQPHTGVSIRDCLDNVIYRCLITFVICTPLPSFLYLMLPSNYIVFFVVCISCVMASLLSIYFVGLNRKEKSFVLSKIPFVNKKR